MRFRAILELGGTTATGVRVPAEVVAALGPSKRPPVRVTINGHTYRSSVASIGGQFMLGVSAENRADDIAHHSGVLRIPAPRTPHPADRAQQ